MADDLLLFYLIEGTNQPSYISVSYNPNGKPVKVDDLRKTIFEDDCKHLATNHKNLTLLKIDMDLAHPGNHLPLLRFKNGDEGVEELCPWKTLSEIWREPPPAYRIHMFVTFTNLPSEIEGHRRTLEAAYLVYYKFWWEGLDELLQPVPGCNLKYLPEEQINSLQLDHLSYNESILLVREEYEVAFGYLKEKERPRRRSAGIVVTGQPGIGKSCFLYYLLFRLLSMKKSVAFQVDDKFLLFQNTGVRLCDITSYSGQIIPDGTWALADSHTGFEKPCAAFLNACKSGRAWVVQTTPPLEDKWRLWENEYGADIYWMDVVTLDELNALGNLLGLSTEILRDSYNSWGPSTRDCLRFAKNPKAIVRHEQDVFRAASELIKDASHFTGFQVPSATHWTFVVRPSADSREVASVEFGTNRLREIFLRAYARQDHAVRCSFYTTIREHSWFASPADQMFEIHFLLWLQHYNEGLSCTYAMANTSHLQIPYYHINPKFFHKAEELKDITDPSGPIWLVPTSRTFPTLDAVVLTSNAVITVQITIALKQNPNEQEFDLVYRNLPPNLLAKRPGRHHVFITDEEINAKSLQEQNHTQVPSGTLVYSMARSVGSWDLKVPATEERVDALEKARAPPSEAMVAED